MAIWRVAAGKDASMSNACFRLLLGNRWSSSLVKASSSADPLFSFSLLARSLPSARPSLMDSIRSQISPKPYLSHTHPSGHFGLVSDRNRPEAIRKLMALDEAGNGNLHEEGDSRMYCMPTFNQLISHERKPKKRSNRTRALEGCPQKAGVCVRVFTRAPKKPNSAQRKLAKVRLSNGKDTFAYIPGEGHNLQEHSIVLIRGGRVPDLPGVKFHCIRGVKDLMGLPNRRQGRSKYGAEKPKSG